jgi:hypothetical protein
MDELLTLLGRLLKNSEDMFETIKKVDLSAASVLMCERVELVNELRNLALAKVFQESSDKIDDLDSLIMKIDSKANEIRKIISEKLGTLTNELKGLTALKSIAVYKAQGGHYGY